MKKVILLIVWFCAAMYVMNVCTSLISMPSTIGAVFGFVMFVSFIILSVETECFINIKNPFKR